MVTLSQWTRGPSDSANSSASSMSLSVTMRSLNLIAILSSTVNPRMFLIDRCEALRSWWQVSSHTLAEQVCDHPQARAAGPGIRVRLLLRREQRTCSPRRLGARVDAVVRSPASRRSETLPHTVKRTRLWGIRRLASNRAWPRRPASVELMMQLGSIVEDLRPSASRADLWGHSQATTKTGEGAQIITQARVSCHTD